MQQMVASPHNTHPEVRAQRASKGVLQSSRSILRDASRAASRPPQHEGQVLELAAPVSVHPRAPPLEFGARNEHILIRIALADDLHADRQAIIIADPLPMVKSTRLYLTLLFQNLLSNALKFRGPKPPHIHVWAQPHTSTTNRRKISRPAGVWVTSGWNCRPYSRRAGSPIAARGVRSERGRQRDERRAIHGRDPLNSGRG